MDNKNSVFSTGLNCRDFPNNEIICNWYPTNNNNFTFNGAMDTGFHK